MTRIQRLSVRMWGSWKPSMFLVGLYNGTAVLQNSPAVPQGVKQKGTIGPRNPTRQCIVKGNESTYPQKR